MDTRAKDGFTLLELLTIVGVIGITGCIAIPMVMNVLPNKNLRSLTREMHSALMKARFEAGSRRTKVIVEIAPSDNTTYKICVDNGRDPVTNKDVGDIKTTANNGKCDEVGDEKEEVLQSGPALPNRVIFNPRIGDNGNNFPDSSVAFNSRGVPKKNGSIGLCTTDLSGEPSKTCRKLVVSTVGRIRVNSEWRKTQ